MSKRLYQIVAVCLLVGFTAGSVSAQKRPGMTFRKIPQKQSQPGKVQRPMRMGNQAVFNETFARHPRKNVLTPILMHAMERYLTDEKNLSPVDAAFRKALAKHPKVQRKDIQAVVGRWRRVPVHVRNKIIPLELRNLDARRKLDMNLVRRLSKRQAARVRIKTKPVFMDFRKAGPINLKMKKNPINARKKKVPNYGGMFSNFKPGLFSSYKEYPGEFVTLTGKFVKGFGDITMRRKKTHDPQVKFNAHSPGVNHVNHSQIELRIPQQLPPGDYEMNYGFGKNVSPWVNFKVRAPYFAINFDKWYCKDESDPEGHGDDPVTAWIGEIDVSKTFYKASTEYENMGYDRRTEPYRAKDRKVLTWHPVHAELILYTKFFEWDDGNLGLVHVMFDAASEIAGMFGPIGEGIGAALDFFNAILKAFGNDPDVLGIKKLAKSAGQLQRLTALGAPGVKLMGEHPKGGDLYKFSKGLYKFYNNDDTGSYRVYFSIYRWHRK